MRIDEIVKVFENQGTVPSITLGRWATDFGKSALRGWKLWSVENKEVLPDQEYIELIMAKKHQDYGNKPLLRFGGIGIVIRVSAKVDRLENLFATKINPANEPIKDTWLDIVAYSALLHMLATGTLLEEKKS
jgi:hypothetical protein